MLGCHDNTNSSPSAPACIHNGGRVQWQTPLPGCHNPTQWQPCYHFGLPETDRHCALLVIRFAPPRQCKTQHRQRSLSRALSVISDGTEQTAELDVVKSTLLKNGYPATFIDNELARLHGKKGKQQSVLSKRDDSYSTTVVIPFVDKTTQAIQRVLRPLCIRVVA